MRQIQQHVKHSSKFSRSTGEKEEPKKLKRFSIVLDSSNFSTLKRVVKGHGSCSPQRESIQTKPEKVKCKGTGEKAQAFLFPSSIRFAALAGLSNLWTSLSPSAGTAPLRRSMPPSLSVPFVTNRGASAGSSSR